jgi:hypothetical protein
VIRPPVEKGFWARSSVGGSCLSGHMEMAAGGETRDLADLAGLSGGELLDHVESVAVVQRRCEVEIFRAALQHAYVNNADTLDPAESARPGRERARRIGGPGTPEVAEFAAASLAGRLGVSTISAGRLMADALDVCHRLPQLWAQVEAGQVRVYLARLVARKTRDLSPEQAAYVDSRVAGYADGRLTWTRFQALVDGVVAAADAEATAAREEQAVRAQFARPSRVDTSAGGEGDHGLRGFFIRAPFGTIAVFDATLSRVAAILADLGDTDTVDQRRVKALLILCRPDLAGRLFTDHAAWADRPADPAELPAEDAEELVVSTGSTDETRERTGPKPVIDWTSLLPRVVVNVHTYAGADAEPVARVQGCGAMSLAWVRDHLTRAAKVIVKPVLDIEGQAPVDAYEIPERHRQAVALMTPADTFPFSSSLEPIQVDHTKPYQHGPVAVGAGQSRIGNYGPMTTGHHRVKTFGKWTVKQPFPGIYLFRDPHGALYLVDHTGTRALPRTEAA